MQASSGWSKEEIAKFTGHKDLSVIDYYLKLYDEKLDDLSQQIQFNSLYWNLKKYQTSNDLKVKLESDGSFTDKRKINRQLREFIESKDKEIKQIRTVSTKEDMEKAIRDDLEPIFKTWDFYEKKLNKK